MRVLTCLGQDHNLWLVLLAALMCVAGSYTSMKLFDRTVNEQDGSRYYWCILSSVTAGAAIWATHFIAMLGYQPDVGVTFDGTLTIVSALIAVVGTFVGLMFAMHRNPVVAHWCGGGLVGLSIAAMHYVGMFAYRVDGYVQWLPEYVFSSIAISIVFCVLAIRELKSAERRFGSAAAVGLLSMAIIGLHFTGMAAFTVIPMEGAFVGADTEVLSALATAIALVAFLIVGAGISTHLLERRSRASSNAKLQHMALHDDLTKIANRRGYNEALKQECQKLKRYGRPFSLMMVDLDRFKPINDTLGHPLGDEVLRRVAGRIRAAVRTGDLVARLGGDEFAIISYGIDDVQTAERAAQRIVDVLARPYVIDGNVAELGASVGVVLAPLNGTEWNTLIHRVDIALYTAKSEGRGQFCMYRESLSVALQRRRQIEQDLRRACMRDDFKIVYQPITDAASGEIIAAEALLRWNCLDRGDVSPAEFIPIAEDLGLVSRIGAGVLKQACRDAAGWDGNISVSVNISPVQLLDPRLPQIVSQAFEEAGLPPERLELEITETALLGNDDLAMRTLLKTKDLGVRISLDDFGTGYSSLSYLHRFPINRIKIDKSFVQMCPNDQNSISIVKAIAQLGKSMGMTITAEGIETADQLDFVTANGCDNLQGFLISHPIASDALNKLLTPTIHGPDLYRKAG